MITTKFYIDQTGDLELLEKEAAYFKDKDVYKRQMLIREREEKIMKKGHCGKMLLLFGAACMLLCRFTVRAHITQ